MRQALQRLERDGYTDQFRAADEGLVARDAGRTFAPESLVVDEIVRFEGASDPSDESALFALRARDDEGVRGTYVVAFGPDMHAADARLVPRLHEIARDDARRS